MSISLGEKLKKLLQRTGQKNASIIPNADLIWKGSILFLIVFFAGAILFDFYTFQTKVQNAEPEFIDVGNDADVPTLKNVLLTETKNLKIKRLERFDKAREKMPSWYSSSAATSTSSVAN